MNTDPGSLANRLDQDRTAISSVNLSLTERTELREEKKKIFSPFPTLFFKALSSVLNLGIVWYKGK